MLNRCKRLVGGISLILCLSAAASGLADYATLEYRDQGSEVLKMQQALNTLGYQTNGLDSKFGPSTEKAVRQFQRDHKLSVDGRAGNQTLTLLYRLAETDTAANTTVNQSATSGKLMYGNRGSDVQALQKALNALGYKTGGTDGKFGPSTYRAVQQFQRDHKLAVDGIAGKATLALLSQLEKESNSKKDAPLVQSPATGNESTPSSTSLRYGDKNNDVKQLQQALTKLGYTTGGVDGHYGAATLNAVKAFQKANRLTADGIAGKATLALLYAEKEPIEESTVSPEPTYATLQAGSSGSEVKALQKALKALDYPVSVDGSYGSETQIAVRHFQKTNGLTVDGVAGRSTLEKLYSGKAKKYEPDTSVSTPVTTISGPDKSQVQLLHWYKQVKPSIKAGQHILVFDPATGISWTLRLYSLGRHADSEPLTKADTDAMFVAFGNKNTWTQKPVYVKLPDGRWTLAATHNVPHLSGSIKDNGFDGHLCVHFLRDMDECSQKDPKYGVSNQNTIRAYWKKLTGETVK